MGKLEALETLTGLLYDSVLDDALWPTALRSLARFVGGVSAAHIIANPSLGAITECFTVDIHPDLKPKYLGYYADKEIRLPPAIAFTPGDVATEESLLERGQLKRSEIFNDLLIPCECPYFVFSWLQKSRDRLESLSIENTLKRGAFSAESIDNFRRVTPHLVRVVRMRDEFAAVREAKGALLHAVNLLPVGVILLDDSGKAIEINPFALRLLEEPDGPKYRSAQVRAPYPEDDTALRTAVAAVTMPAPGRHTQARTLALRRSHGRSPIAVTLLGVTRADRIALSQRAAALMVLVDPDLKQPVQGEVLRSLFGLSPAEAALVSTLIEMDSLSDAAAHLDRSLATVRTQLKSVYAKTGCRSRSSLIRTIAMGSLAASGSHSS